MRKNKDNKKKWYDCAKLPTTVMEVYDKVNKEAAELLKNRKKVENG